MTESEPKRLMADQPALVTHCQQCEERVHANRHIKAVDGRCYAICYDCAGEDEGQEPEQQKLVTDGGYEIENDYVIEVTPAPAPQTIECPGCDSEFKELIQEDGISAGTCPECGDWLRYDQGRRDPEPEDKTEQTTLTDGGTVPESVDEIVSNGGRDADGSPRMLSRWTFQYTPARMFVERRLEGRVLNACAGKTELNHDGEIVRNDLNPERNADHHLDVVELPEHFEPRSFDTVVFDPPFDEEQAETKYDGLHASDVYGALEGFEKLVRPGGVVICFGWNSWGMRSFGAFEREETYLFQRGPIHRDVIATIDRRTSSSLATNGDSNRSVGTGTPHSEGSR